MSWVLGLCSILLPATMFAYYARDFSKTTAASTATYVCGMPLLSAMMLCLAIALVLSLAALVLALTSFRRLERPRPLTRLIEAIAVGGVSIVLPLAALTAWLLD